MLHLLQRSCIWHCLIFRSEDPTLYWHQDGSDKFVVKREPGPYRVSAPAPAPPLVKVVRYDPASQEQYRGKVTSGRRVEAVLQRWQHCTTVSTAAPLNISYLQLSDNRG